MLYETLRKPISPGGNMIDTASISAPHQRLGVWHSATRRFDG